MVAAPPVLRQWGLERVGFRFPDALPSGRGEGPQSTPPVRHVPEKHLHHTQTHQVSWVIKNILNLVGGSLTGVLL